MRRAPRRSSTAAGVDGCRYDVDAGDLHAALGVTDTTTLNVSLVHDGSVATIDGVRLAAGPTPPDTADVQVGRRLGLVDGTRVSVLVRVW